MNREELSLTHEKFLDFEENLVKPFEDERYQWFSGNGTIYGKINNMTFHLCNKEYIP